MMKWLMGAALLGVLALGGALYSETKRSARLKADNAALAASVSTLKAKGELAQASRKVLAEELMRRSERAAEFDKMRVALERGGEDEDLPDWFVHYVDCLLAGSAGAGRPDCP